MKFSVLMSVYIKEKPCFLRHCLDSLHNQILRADEIVLVEDGEITKELESVILEYACFMPIKTVKLSCNQGLAAALNEGLKHCSHDLVARMDTDDVSLPNRFKCQIEFMMLHPDVDVCGSWFEEKNQALEGKSFVKKLPISHEAITRYARHFSPMCHAACMYKKKAVVAGGGYPLIFPEDYALWSLMLMNGYRFQNIPEILMCVRGGDGLIARRGLEFFKGEVGLLVYQKSIGFLNLGNFLINFMTHAIIRLSPFFVRKILYKFAR